MVPSRPSSSRPPTKGLDDYSEVLGMTPRQHEQKMRKWYVLLAVALFFSVFGEGFLMLSARLKEKREAEARRAKGAVTEPVRQAPMTPSVPSTVPPAPD
ncbi:MAG TPA: hypothetical protein PKH96_24015, partial [Gemmatimonadaceae bacterium]|nr:hypothetical protein [Gemmatimonadaceae bacterium]